MEKSFSVLETNGTKTEETFTFRIYATKSMLQKQLQALNGRTRCPDMSPVSFKEGLLKDITNSFELNILSSLTGVEVFYSANLDPGVSLVEISSMKFSLLAEGVTLFQANLIKKSVQPVVDPYFRCFGLDHMEYNLNGIPYGSSVGEINPSPKRCFSMPKSDARHWCIPIPAGHKHDLNSHSWPDSANEVKIDITISKPTSEKLAFELFIEVLLLEKSKFVETQGILPAFYADDRTGYFDRVSKYFLSNNLSDVTIRCNGETFPAHQFILSDSSPVFAKMFENEMKESKEKAVNIKDAEPNVVREMLRFFYTGCVEHLEDIDTSLYTLADIYMVDNLKILCVRSLIAYVNIDTALDMYCFGKNNDIPPLAKKAERVIITNRKQIIKENDDLQTLMKSVPDTLARDLFQLLWDT